MKPCRVHGQHARTAKSTDQQNAIDLEASDGIYSSLPQAWRSMQMGHMQDTMALDYFNGNLLQADIGSKFLAVFQARQKLPDPTTHTHTYTHTHTAPRSEQGAGAQCQSTGVRAGVKSTQNLTAKYVKGYDATSSILMKIEQQLQAHSQTSPRTHLVFSEAHSRIVAPQRPHQQQVFTLRNKGVLMPRSHHAHTLCSVKRIAGLLLPSGHISSKFSRSGTGAGSCPDIAMHTPC
eukprot:scaffold19821_cov18-Tisochrysis_lutea.AAC.1